MSVKRYKSVVKHHGDSVWLSLIEDEDGNLVEFEDYAALEAKVARLLAELKTAQACWKEFDGSKPIREIRKLRKQVEAAKEWRSKTLVFRNGGALTSYVAVKAFDAAMKEGCQQ